LVIWAHVDTGSNVHIVNERKVLHKFRATKNKTLGQVTGDRKTIHGIGEWHICIDDRCVILHNVLYMPDNPTCTLSTGSLKRLDGFISAAHDALSQVHLVCPIGINHKYTPSNKDLRNVNGLDYIPLTTLPPQPINTEFASVPNLSQHPDGEGYISNAATVYIPRRSTRIKQMPRRFREQNSPSSPSSPFPLPVPSIIQVSMDMCSISSSSIYSPIPPHISTSNPKSQHPSLTTSLQNLLIHLKFGCRNLKNIAHMSKHSSLVNLPHNIGELHRQCPICMHCKMNKLPRNPPIPVDSLAPGQMLQLDFGFMNVTSIRGFTSYLSCDCVKTKYPFRFCTRNKRAPVDVIKWIITTLRGQGKKVQFVRFDEGGELARSKDVNKMLVEDFQIIMQTTGGYASHLNGVTEREHRTDADSIRTSLYAAGLDDNLWCYALLHSTFINRRWCRYPSTVTPYEM